MKRTLIAIAIITFALLAGLPGGARAQAGASKSAEEIIEGLLGGDEGTRGLKGGVRETTEKDREPKITIPIQFEYNSAEITASSLPQLETVARALNDPRLQSYTFRVEGHTDNLGSDAYNLSLSQRRASAVKAYLTQKLGVSPAHLEAVGYGETRPLAGVSQDTEEGRALNRRVVFSNLSLGKAGVTGASAPPPSQLSVDVLVNYESSGEVRVLKPGDALTPNDNYRVTFTPSADSHIYVFQIDARGEAARIFPNDDYSSVANPVKGRKTYVVPPEGKWLSLDQVSGEEEIVLLASRTALAEPQAVAMQVRGQAVNVVTRGAALQPRADLSGAPAADLFSYRLPFLHK